VVSDPAAKRRQLADRNPLANSPDSPRSPVPSTPSTLDQIDLEIIQYPAGVRTWGNLKEGNLTMNVTLCTEFTKPENIIKAVTLLAQISSNTAPTIDATTIPSSLAVNRTNPFHSLLTASNHANTHLQQVEGAISVTRMKTIMSYLVIFFTLEYAVVPKLKEERPNEGQRSIAAMKYQQFAEMLNASKALHTSTESEASNAGNLQAQSGSRNPTPVSAARLRSHCKYGKVFWEYGQSLGIASLLVFAVLDTGLAKIGEVGLRGVSGMAADLMTSGTWWAFAHAIGPAAFRTLFGARDVAYTVPQLMSSILVEPVPQPSQDRAISALSEAYTRTQLQPRDSSTGNQQPTPSEPETQWQIVIGNNILPVRRHPAGTLEQEQVRKRNLGDWLHDTPGDEVVQYNDGNTIPFTAFQTLLPLHDISTDLVNFFISTYNTKAMPGRVGIPFESLSHQSRSLEQFLLALPKGPNRDAGNPEKIIMPIDLETATIGISIFPKDSVAITYNWTRNGGLTDGIVQVCT
jgi:hypothetical protein